jgi:hypothetical protein
VGIWRSEKSNTPFFSFNCSVLIGLPNDVHPQLRRTCVQLIGPTRQRPSTASMLPDDAIFLL